MPKTTTVATLKKGLSGAIAKPSYPSRKFTSNFGDRDTGIAVNGAFTSIFSSVPVEVYSDEKLLTAYYNAAVTQAR